MHSWEQVEAVNKNPSLDRELKADWDNTVETIAKPELKTWKPNVVGTKTSHTVCWSSTWYVVAADDYVGRR